MPAAMTAVSFWPTPNLCSSSTPRSKAMPQAAEACVVVPPEFPYPPVAGKMINGKYEGKYDIHDPAKVKFVERTDFLKSICGHIDQEETLEDVIIANGVGYSPAWGDLRSMAKQYSIWKNKGARLPKFSRWVTGMFAGNAEYAKILADEGQRAAKRKIIMSGELLDILRCA